MPLLFAALIPLGAAAADAPGKHPAYLHALSDLRAAHTLIEQRPGGSAQVHADEQRAIMYIDETINEIKRASIDDGKNLDDHPPVDTKLDRNGQLHQASELLHKARTDIAQQEDSGANTRGLRNRALMHLDKAIQATDLAIKDATGGR
ncbi:MAG TPA: hypothetical protein VJO99_28135 [Burkholderiaceae bacterium]|nr:hypothetical protein [Burkholderiaceae bacterium]